MKHTRRFVLSVALCALLPASVQAAVSVPNPPVAKPMSAWLVGPSQVSSFDAAQDGKGCLMVTEFDNGMIIGLHARQQGIMGMTVDMRQGEKLTPGETKQIGLNIGTDAYVIDAHAGDVTTLSINLDVAGGGKAVAERLTNLGSFRLLIDDVPHYMATTGFTDGLARLQACMGGMMAVTLPVTGPGDTAGKVNLNTQIETMRVTSSGHETPLALAMPNLVPSGYRFVLDGVDPMTPISWQAGDDWLAVMRNALTPHGYRVIVDAQTVRISARNDASQPVVEAAQDKDIAFVEDLSASAFVAQEIPDGVWAGAKGQNLSDVLEAWGLMSGVNVRVDLDGDYKLLQDVRFEGRFDDAVQDLLSQYTGDNRPSGTFLGLQNNAPAPMAEPAASNQPNWQPSRDRVSSLRRSNVVSDTYQMAPIPDPKGAPEPKNLKNSGTWSAMAGTSLRTVFDQWGKESGVQVIWNTDQSFPLAANIKHQGKFEEAVQAALVQFTGQGVRPAAQLNQDPDTGARALIINATR